MVITLASFAAFVIIGFLGRSRFSAHVAIAAVSFAAMTAFWLTGRV